MITIKDVAREAGVSIATVSRTLNDNYPVKDETRQKVIAAAEKLKYRPNDIARSLKQNRTDTIGLVVPDLSNPYFMEIAVGIENIVSEYGYNILFANTQEDKYKEIKYLETFYERRVDLLVLATRQTNANKINELIDQGLKIILVDSSIKDVKTDIILEDNYGGAYDLTMELIKNGHRDIGIIKGLMTVSTAKERLKGFIDACRESGIEIKRQYIIEGLYNREQTYKNTLKSLDNWDKLPTAMFSTNNYMTEGFMVACKENNIGIPKDISLVSFGEITVPKLVEPRLSIIKQDSEKIGKLVGELILKKLNCDNHIYKEHIVEPKIQKGDSIKNIL